MKKLIILSLVGMSVSVYGSVNRPSTPEPDHTNPVLMEQSKTPSPSKDSVTSNSSLSSNPLSDDLDRGEGKDLPTNTSPVLEGRNEENISPILTTVKTSLETETALSQSSEHATSAEGQGVEKTIYDIVAQYFSGKDLLDLTDTGGEYVGFLDKLFGVFAKSQCRWEQECILLYMQNVAYADPCEIFADSSRYDEAKPIVDKANEYFSEMCGIFYPDEQKDKE